MQSIEALQNQLFRYAQDLQVLMAEQVKLQQRHQKVLQFMGRGEKGNHLLVNTLLQSIDLYLVTDGQGEILHASPAADKALSVLGLSLNWQSIAQLMPSHQRAGINALLRKFLDQRTVGAIQLYKLIFGDGTFLGGEMAYEALVVQGGGSDDTEIYWLLGQAGQPDKSVLQIMQTCSLLAEGDEALVITEPDGNIISVNPAFTRVTGYTEDDVVGQNPRILSSGLQDAEFYKIFWDGLEDTGTWTGEFFNRRKNGHIFFEWVSVKVVQDVNNKTVAYISAFADMSHPDESAQHLPLLVYHDPLTGLPNRRLFEDRLTQAITSMSLACSGLCVLSISLNRFKSIADDLGHEVGDLLLLECGARLEALMRPGDALARVGGAEFLVLLSSVDTKIEAEMLANTMLVSIANPILLRQQQLSVSASMGCARYPQDGEDTLALIKRAGAAMYAAKRFGTEFFFYEAGHVSRLEPESNLESNPLTPDPLS